MASVVQWHTHRVAASGLPLFYVFRRRNSKKRWRNRKVWVKPYIARNPFLRVYNTLVQELRAEDKVAFKIFFADGSSFTFDELLEMVRPLTQKQDTNMRQSIPAGEKLTLTLRYILRLLSVFFPLCIHIIVGYTYFCWRYEQSYAIQQWPETSLISQYYGLYNCISTLFNNK